LTALVVVLAFGFVVVLAGAPCRLIGAGAAFVVLGGVLFTGAAGAGVAVTEVGDVDGGGAAVGPVPAEVAPAGTGEVELTGADA
jgi:hypothetical protein